MTFADARSFVYFDQSSVCFGAEGVDINSQCKAHILLCSPRSKCRARSGRKCNLVAFSLLRPTFCVSVFVIFHSFVRFPVQCSCVWAAYLFDDYRPCAFMCVILNSQLILLFVRKEAKAPDSRTVQMDFDAFGIGPHFSCFSNFNCVIHNCFSFTQLLFKLATHCNHLPAGHFRHLHEKYTHGVFYINRWSFLSVCCLLDIRFFSSCFLCTCLMLLKFHFFYMKTLYFVIFLCPWSLVFLTISLSSWSQSWIVVSNINLLFRSNDMRQFFFTHTWLWFWFFTTMFTLIALFLFPVPLPSLYSQFFQYICFLICFFEFLSVFSRLIVLARLAIFVFFPRSGSYSMFLFTFLTLLFSLSYQLR